MIAENLTTTDLTSFGNFLLSEERKQYIDKDHQAQVWHADFENWKHLNGKQ